MGLLFQTMRNYISVAAGAGELPTEAQNFVRAPAGQGRQSVNLQIGRCGRPRAGHCDPLNLVATMSECRSRPAEFYIAFYVTHTGRSCVTCGLLDV